MLKCIDAWMTTAVGIMDQKWLPFCCIDDRTRTPRRRTPKRISDREWAVDVYGRERRR